MRKREKAVEQAGRGGVAELHLNMFHLVFTVAMLTNLFRSRTYFRTSDAALPKEKTVLATARNPKVAGI